MLQVQRKLLGDCGKWRTIGRTEPDELDDIMSVTDHLARKMKDIFAMRLVNSNGTAHAVLATWVWDTGWKLNEISQCK